MTLSDAELIADQIDLAAYTREQIAEALARLQTPSIVARMRNVKNERTLERWQNRIVRLEDEISAIAYQDEARRI